MAKKTKKKKAVKKKVTRRSGEMDPETGERLYGMGKIAPAPNDHISSMIGELVPKELRGDDRFLDIITWNIRFFTSQFQNRVVTIADIMGQLNADIFVLQEIADQSLDPVVERLIDAEAGSYKVEYGLTGGDQRVAFIYDLDWVRAKEPIAELFANESIIDPDSGKDSFPRRPLHTQFTAHREASPFDFHLVGVHLKSQRDGGDGQRKKAAERLMRWVEAESSDEDAIILGDWNSKANKPEWASVRKLENEGKVRFLAWNPANEASHFFRDGKGSKLDYFMVTEAAAKVGVDGLSRVVPWKSFHNDDTIRRSIINHVSDHLPTLSRFYFRDTD